MHVPEKHIPSPALTASHGVSTRVHSSQQSKQRPHPALTECPRPPATPPGAGPRRRSQAGQASVLTRALASRLQGPCKEVGTQALQKSTQSWGCWAEAGRAERSGGGGGDGDSWGQVGADVLRPPQTQSPGRPAQGPGARAAGSECAPPGACTPRDGGATWVPEPSVYSHCVCSFFFLDIS